MTDKNFNDYLDTHHNTSVELLAYNIIDYLIFSEISYLDLSDFIPSKQNPDQGVLLWDASAHFYLRKDYYKKQNPTMTRNERLKAISYLYRADRYKKVKVFGHTNLIDKDKNIQFSALTFQTGVDEFVIVFRGTDDTLVGWKEDFYLAISDRVPAQEEAVKYLNTFSQLCPGAKITIVGHSKGGNLAMYSAIFAPKYTKDQIQAVHAFDPVGFNKKLINDIKNIPYDFPINRYIPEEAYVGLMMYYPVEAKIVKSRQHSLRQHAPEYWLVDGDDFVYTDTVKGQGKFFNTILKRWAEKVSADEFKAAIDIIFDSFDQGNVDSLNQFFTNPLETISSLYKVSDQMSSKDQVLVSEVFNHVWQITLDELSQSVESDLEESYQEITKNVNKSWDEITESLKVGWDKLSKLIDKKAD